MKSKGQNMKTKAQFWPGGKSGFVKIMVLAVILLAGVILLHGSDHNLIRYRVTVTVETPEGIKTGSAVREASMYHETSILPDQGGTFYNIAKGQAVAVDLGKRGVLFVLLGGEG